MFSIRDGVLVGNPDSGLNFISTLYELDVTYLLFVYLTFFHRTLTPYLYTFQGTFKNKELIEILEDV